MGQQFPAGGRAGITPSIIARKSRRRCARHTTASARGTDFNAGRFHECLRVGTPGEVEC